MLPDDLVAKLSQCATNDFVKPRDHWFHVLAGFTGTVFVGLLLEFPELRYELKLIARDWIPYFRHRILTPPEHRLHAAKVLAFVGWLLIVAGVGGERYAEVKVKDLDASIQECSDSKVREAILEAGDAATSAKNARDEADAAKDAAGKAVAASSKAAAAANGALLEVNSSEADIKVAKQQAAEAEAHLSDALKIGEEATAQLNRLKEPRSLIETEKSLNDLKRYKNTKYAFTSVAADAEAIALLVKIDDLLTSAGWQRVPPERAMVPPAIQPRGDSDLSFVVPQGLGVGLTVRTHSSLPNTVLNTMASAAWPNNAKAAMTLNTHLWTDMYPAPPRSEMPHLVVDLGTSEVVEIDVGRKPY